MKEIFRDYLFDKGYLVAEDPDYLSREYSDTEIACMIVALGRKCGIRIRHGCRLLTKPLVKYAIEKSCVWVPEPFYRGFPQSVRNLTEDELLFDQLLHYAQTYGLGIFEGEAQHSILETVHKTAFNEDTEPKDYAVLTEQEAEKVLLNVYNNLLASTRPLGVSQMDFLTELLAEYTVCYPEKIGCKMTAVDLLIHTHDFTFANYLVLPDAIKVLERIQYLHYGSDKINRLNLKNSDRKLLKNVLDTLFDREQSEAAANRMRNLEECFEKRETWKGLLHHLHYQTKNKVGMEFIAKIRNSATNCSAYSSADFLSNYGDCIWSYAHVLREKKGPSAVLRNLDYILSRCKTEEDVKEVFKCLD